MPKQGSYAEALWGCLSFALLAVIVYFVFFARDKTSPIGAEAIEAVRARAPGSGIGDFDQLRQGKEGSYCGTVATEAGRQPFVYVDSLALLASDGTMAALRINQLCSR